MKLEEIERTLDEVRGGHGGVVSEFEALQDIVTALTLRFQAIGQHDHPFGILPWYIRRLLILDEELSRLINQAEVPYQLVAREPKRVARLRIRAILDSLPETAEVEEAVAKR